MRVFAPGRLGKKQSTTPEGFLLCEEVPLARTGELLYGPNEGIPVEPGRDGIIRIVRTEEEVFHPRALASFEGKPVTNDHPDEDVTPANWKKYAVGIVRNVRRGTGDLDDCMVADLLIMAADAIAEVRKKEDGEEEKREVSCGYDADYEQLGPGKGAQYNIVGNHVALVDKGRCGPRCAIGDAAMAGKKKQSVKDRIWAAFGARDAEGLAEALKEEGIAKDEGEIEGGEGGDTHVHVHLNGEQNEDAPTVDEGEQNELGEVLGRIDALEQTVATLAEAVAQMVNAENAEVTDAEGEEPEETMDAEGEEPEEDPTKAGAKDRARTGDAANTLVRDTVSRAEILCPGIKISTFDSKGDPKKFRDSLCAFKRKALKGALATEAGKKAVTTLLGGQKADFTKMTCDAVGTLFIGASELVKQANSNRGVGLSRDGAPVKMRSIADINKANADFWAKRQG